MGIRYVFSVTTSDSANALATSPRWSVVCWEMFTALAGFVSLATPATLPWASASLVSASVPASATGGAPGFMDWSGSTAAGSTSYRTSMRSSASSAIASSSAVTAATGCPTKTTRSMASTAWARVGALRFSWGMSAAVMTARTPGSARARLVSILTMRAWACGLRRSLACKRPRGLRSATYWTCPVTFSGPSGRGMASPTPLTSRVVFIVVAMGSSLPGGRGARDFGDRGQHLRVAGAAAQVSGDSVADLFFGRVWILGEQRRRRHQDPGNAESALRHAEPHEGVLQRVQGVEASQSFNRPDGTTSCLEGQHEAARDGLAVEMDSARAAITRATAFLGPGELEVLAERVEQRHVGLDEDVGLLVVQGEAQDLLGHANSSRKVSERRARAPSSMCDESGLPRDGGGSPRSRADR